MSDQAQANICESHHFVWTWPINDPGHGSIGVCDLCGAVKVDECRPMRDPMTADDLAEKVAAVLRSRIAAQLCNVSNLPEPLQAPALGLNLGPLIDRIAAALLPLIREREAAAWDSAVQAVAWLLDNGEPSAFAALAYTAKNNPYAGSEGA